MTTTLTARPETRYRHWRFLAGLLLFAVVPLGAGVARLVQLAQGGAITADNARFVAVPAPVVVHIVAAAVFWLLGGLQFVPALRSRGRRWHRYAGRVVLAAGFATASSGLWMTLFYPRPASDDLALEAVRLVVGSAMLVALVLGLVAVRNRRFATHRRWLVRAYAIALGAGTQVLTNLPWAILVGPPSGFVRTVLMTAGWAINVALAEWWLAHRSRAV